MINPPEEEEDKVNKFNILPYMEEPESERKRNFMRGELVVLSSRRERSELDLKFDDDQHRKKGKTAEPYEEYCDLWKVFETLKGFTLKRNRYLKHENITKTPGIFPGDPDIVIDASYDYVPWVRETIAKLEKDAKVAEELAELKDRKQRLEKDIKDRATKKYDPRLKEKMELEEQIKEKEQEVAELTPLKKVEIEKLKKEYGIFEKEQIQLWKAMESVIDKLSQNKYVASRFKNFYSMSVENCKNGLYDQISD